MTNPIDDNTTLPEAASPSTTIDNKAADLSSFVKGGMKIRQDRIHRVRDKYRELGIKAHPGTISRVAMGKKLTATQFYKLQSQLPAQIAYALQDAREKMEVESASSRG